ncbi:hypothetical protein B0T25DRAFT_582095 [Lasiosphaeria hispida]|uniref:Apple domain-containing protein n=1 Tax=Lasiosphaeria hispida TaxID=260671 RepID=A0AAJ0HEC7_9PEZI|nr:hypothetical protein B0T25DRAFT_582095 [Lasiosphaeria hispida]
MRFTTLASLALILGSSAVAAVSQSLMSIRSSISCNASNNTIYEAPNGKKYLVACEIDHIDFSIGNLASSWQPSYEACADFCSGNTDCQSLAYGPTSASGVNCWLKSFSDHITPSSLVWGGVAVQSSRTSSSSTSSTTTTSSGLMTTATPSPSSPTPHSLYILLFNDLGTDICRWRIYDAPSNDQGWDVCKAIPNQEIHESACKPPYPNVPELEITFNPGNEQGCDYFPDYSGQKHRRLAQKKSSNTSIIEMRDEPELHGQVICGDFTSDCVADPASNSLLFCDFGMFVPRVRCDGFME